MPYGAPLWGGWWIVPLIMLGFVVVAALTMRSFMGGGACGHTAARSGGDDALDIARRRYAAGEITREQYEEMRRDLDR